ncbi:DinB family protein [Pararhodonellum marinum]|uniref:DinB family protein n=1 Tax=Pararhodonellum marinum TaxID=2755358 RepID=UPI0018904B2E|nr:DinB family protein [Pararhodonellum marinum]
MKLQNKETWIEKMEKMVEEQIAASTKIFQNLPEEALLFSVAEAWSAAACIDHLNSYAAFYLPRVKKVLATQRQTKDSTPIKLSWLGTYFITMMKPVENGKKFKAMKKHYPNAITNNPHKIVADFIQYLEEILVMLSRARFSNLNRGRIGSSISHLLRLRPCDTIEFLLVHNERHLIQAKKQVKAYQNHHALEK